MHPSQHLGTYYGDILRGVEEESRRSRHTVYFSTDAKNLGVLGGRTPPTDPTGRGARGVIYAGDATRDMLDPLQQAGTPIVIINACFPEANVNCIMCDNFSATYRTIQWLVHLGHRRIACIAGGSSNVSSLSERKMGYRQGLLDAGIAFDPALLTQAQGFTVPEGQEATAGLLDRSPPPTAIFGTSDELAVGAIQAVRDAGLSVPRDVSVVGVNDLPMAATCRPRLTTLRIFRNEMGHAAVQRLLELIRNPRQRPRRIDVLCELVERESVARARST
jgi:LacI family transcriptional regulator, galactose operon repressor